MRRFIPLFAIALACCAGPTRVTHVQNTPPATLNLLNFCTLGPGVVGGGQVHVADFPEMAASGYTLVVNLRLTGEDFPINEQALAEDAGLAYLHIPMGGDDLVAAHAHQLADALAAHGSGHVLVHCASGNRVGALWGLHVGLRDGLNADQANEIARKSGMRSESLAACVRAALSRSAAPYGFQAYGSMMEVLRNGQTQARVKLTDVNGPNVVGVGALAELTGELTLDGGHAHVTAVSEGSIHFPTTDPDAAATLLAVANVPHWNQSTLPAIESLEDLEAAIAAAAAAAGIDTQAIPALPFRVEGDFEGLCLHVLNGSCPIADPDGPEPWRLTDATASGVLVGFFAEDAAGQLTHHGQRSHTHAIVTTQAGLEAGGHVDATAVSAGATLFLPAD